MKGNEANKNTHPSYGLLQFSRMTGGPTNLFGSSIQHKDTIRLRINECAVERNLSTDWYYDQGKIIEVEMSYSQFAEAITSINMGSGVPVTIRYIKGEGSVEPCPFVDKKQLFEEEFKHKLDEANATTNQLISNVEKLFTDKKTLTKKDKEEVLSMLTKIYQSINNNSSFVYESFNEQMGKTTLEAKGEIEAFMQNKLNSIAQTSIAEHRDELLSLKNPVTIQSGKDVGDSQ